MEQNHIPSSPLHHRPTSRDSNTGNEERPEQLGESSRTKLPDLHPHAHNHGGPSTSPQHTTAGLAWPGEPPAASPMPSSPDPGWQAPTPTWSQEPFASTSSLAAVPSTSSSTVRPTSPPRAPPLDRPPPLAPPSRHSAIPSLLTSQPLDRCASSISAQAHSPRSSSSTRSPRSPRPSRRSPQPCPSSPPPVVTGKRSHRSTSLPPSIPAFKKRRGYSPDQPLPSEHYERTLVPLKKRATRLELQQARADTWARAYRRRPYTETQTFVAARSPPINLASLKALDAHEILKSPTLRHDLIFDNIAFRPLNSPYPSEMLSAPSHAMLPPNAGRDENGTQAAEMYWEAIGHEISRGCSCLRWKVSVEWPADGGEAIHRLERRVRDEECVCQGRQLALTDAEWWDHQRTTAWPSRIPELIQTLKEILLSLMGSTTPCPNHFSYSFSQEALQAHEATCPTVTHALVPQLSAALDPDFLTLQIRRGVMGTSIFRLIGEAMKVHCAPLRDSMVDDMIETALSTPAAEGVIMALRKCFACVEIMKLDIANHQVHALRPYLSSHCFGNEISSLKSYLASQGRTLDTSKMRDWIRSASKEVLQGISPNGRRHVIGECACHNNSELVLRSLAAAFVGTVFTPAWIEEGVWPPAGSFDQGQVAVPANDNSTVVEIPESLRMDVRRLRGYHSGAVEIALTHLLLLACRNVWTSLRPTATLGEQQLALADLASEIQDILPGAAIRDAITRQSSTDENSELAVYLAHRLLDLTVDGDSNSTARRTQVDEIARTLDAYISTHLQPHSSLFLDSLARIKTVLAQQLTNEMLSLQHDPNGSRYKPQAARSACAYETPLEAYLAAHPLDPDTGRQMSNGAADRQRFALIGAYFGECEMAEMKKHGLEPLQPAIRKLVERMAVLANFNVGVFGNYYRRKGMIVGA